MKFSRRRFFVGLVPAPAAGYWIYNIGVDLASGPDKTAFGFYARPELAHPGDRSGK